MKTYIFVIILTFYFVTLKSVAQNSSELIGKWKPISFIRYEKGVLTKQGKLKHNRKVNINSDGTMGYFYVYYHGLFPHRSRKPLINRWKFTDSTLYVYSQYPPKFKKADIEEKPSHKLVVDKLIADTLIIVETDAFVRVYHRYLRLK